MKISQQIAKEISAALRANGEKQDVDDTTIYILEDISAAFGPNEQSREVFQGISFEMIGRDFHVLPNLGLLISESAVENPQEDEVYVVEDGRFVELAGEYLQWRAKLLTELKA